MRAVILIVYIFIIFPACKNQVPEHNLTPNYFSMDSLVSQQVRTLNVLDPQLEKVAVLDDKSESVRLHLDSLAWENELKVFRDANIDKPAFYGYYTRRAAQQDTFSNLLYDEYVMNVSQKLPVKNLKVYYLDEIGTIKRIEILIKDKNELFMSERHLWMGFENRQGIAVLSSYKVSGSQKLTLNDSVKYEMKGTLIF